MKIFLLQLSKLALSNCVLQRRRKWFVLLAPRAPGQLLANVLGTGWVWCPWDLQGCLAESF
jgi:hypothetical protein